MITVGVLHWIFVVFAATSTPYGQAGRKQTSALSDRTLVTYVPLRSATECERAAFLALFSTAEILYLKRSNT